MAAEFTLRDEGESNHNCVVADRSTVGGDIETVMVWMPQQPDERARRPVSRASRINRDEVILLDEIEDTISQNPTARRTVLVPTLEGFTRDFRTEAHKLAVNIRVPVQFFDAPFSIEEAPGTASAINSLRDNSLINQRVPQPYLVGKSNQAPSNDDLFVTLCDKFVKERRRPTLRIIVGPAGTGKSFLFRSLFTSLYGHFLQQKKGHIRFPRPIPLLPEYLKRTHVRTDALIQDFLDTDVATPVRPKVFEWMLINGYSTWLFDGLDELYAGDGDFFDYILDLLTREKSQTQLLICARESLLTTNEKFAQFIEDFGEEQSIELYRLSDWERQSKRALAWLRLEDRTPRPGDNDTRQVSDFLRQISQNEAIDEISRVPYYCDLLLDAFISGSLEQFDDEFSVLEHAVKQILKREEEKGLLPPEYISSHDLNEWLEVTAVLVYHANYKALKIDAVKEYASLVINPDLSEEESTQAITSLVQFPLFSKGMTPGTVNFKHELIAEYLAAKYLLRKLELEEEPSKIENHIGEKLDFAESLALRFISKEIENDSEVQRKIARALMSQTTSDKSFAYLLQILIAAYPETTIFRNNAQLLESRNLRGILFKNLDLSDVSFRHSDLAEARFVSCNLRNTKFEGALLSETHFNVLSDDSLQDANFANLERCQSILVDDERFSNENRDRLWEWIEERTKTQQRGHDPCPAAMELRFLFRKYIHDDGTARRDVHTIEALLRGKRFEGSPNREDCVETCRHHGYLTGPDARGRLKRAQGEKYNEMVKYVTNWTLSDGIRQILDSLCSRNGCQHIPF